MFYQNIMKILIKFAFTQLGKKLLASLLGPQEGESSKILPNAHFFKVGLGNMSKYLYLCIFVLIYGIRYISGHFVFGLNK